jgi:CBS domain containing-hemolysin-like protein
VSQLLLVAMTGALLLANAFFVGAEFALISARRDRLEALLHAGDHRAATVLRAGEQVSLMLAGAQLGITLCALGLGALSEPAIASLIESALGPVGIPSELLHPIAFTVALLLVVVLHIVIGEMVPKNIAIAGPERSALLLVPAHAAFVRLVRPMIALFNLIANTILRLVRVEPKDELDSAYTRTELAEMIGESRREGLLDESGHRRLSMTLSSSARTVADVLVPLDHLTTLPEHPTVADVEAAVAETGFSRFPLLGTDGGITGYLHIKDILDYVNDPSITTIPTGRIRNLPAVPTNARLDEAVTTLRRAQSHLAKALDPDGTVVGMVALEDLVEEYVGTVRDATHVH